LEGELEFTNFINIINPKEKPMMIHFTSASNQTVPIIIYDMQGLKIRKLEGINGQAVWDGRNDSGDSVASNIYVLVLKSGNHISKKKVAIIH
jgi:hypothetical protein